MILLVFSICLGDFVKILGIETATSRGAVAVAHDDVILAIEEWENRRSHSEYITAAIQKCLKTSNLSFEDLDRIVVDSGPGSFTGVRIAASVAKTISYATGVGIYPVNSLRVLAASVPKIKDSAPIVSVINAFKNMLYVGTFRQTDSGLLTIEKPCAKTVKDFEAIINEPHICVGEGFLDYETYFSPLVKSRLIRNEEVSDFPLVQSLCQIAIEAPRENSTFDWNSYEPLYIRASEAEEKMRAGILKPVKNREV